MKTGLGGVRWGWQKMPYAVVRPAYVYAPCGPKSLPNVTDHYDNLITLFIIITPVPWENDSKQTTSKHNTV